MNKFKNAVGQVRHTMLDTFEFQATICQLRLPTWGFKDVNQWFETLESNKYITPNGFISYDKRPCISKVVWTELTVVISSNSVQMVQTRSKFTICTVHGCFSALHLYRSSLRKKWLNGQIAYCNKVLDHVGHGDQRETAIFKNLGNK